MPVKPEDKPLEKLRQETIDQLIMNYSHGELSLEAFERRLDEATKAEHHKELIKLTADLDLQVDSKYAEQKNTMYQCKYEPGDAKESECLVNVFSGSERVYSNDLPQQINLFDLFSGSTIDLTDACFRQPRLTIRTFSLFSGPTVYVPENIRVISNVFCIFGSVSNKASSSFQTESPTIYIEGIAIFSGFDIKLKKSIKERLVEFAQSVKRTFSAKTKSI